MHLLTGSNSLTCVVLSVLTVSTQYNGWRWYYSLLLNMIKSTLQNNIFMEILLLLDSKIYKNKQHNLGSKSISSTRKLGLPTI